MSPPSPIGKSAEEILDFSDYLDSVGYLFRAVAWLDYFKRSGQFPALLYASIEGRQGIEYLLFEQLIIGTGANLQQEEYERCLKNRTRLSKIIDQLIPDYAKLQEFTSVVVSLQSGTPNLVHWNPKNLMKSWGELSNYLHWMGAKNRTTEVDNWKQNAHTDLERVHNHALS